MPIKCEKRDLVPVPPPPVEYVLTLSHDEAVALSAALWGVPWGTHQVARDVSRALDRAMAP